MPFMEIHTQEIVLYLKNFNIIVTKFVSFIKTFTQNLHLLKYNLMLITNLMQDFGLSNDLWHKIGMYAEKLLKVIDKLHIKDLNSIVKSKLSQIKLK